MNCEELKKITGMRRGTFIKQKDWNGFEMFKYVPDGDGPNEPYIYKDNRARRMTQEEFIAMLSDMARGKYEP